MQWQPAQCVRYQRPFAFLRAMIFLPSLSVILAKNPNFLFLLIVLGYND